MAATRRFGFACRVHIETRCQRETNAVEVSLGTVSDTFPCADVLRDLIDIPKRTDRVERDQLDLPGGVLKSATAPLIRAVILSGMAIDRTVWVDTSPTASFLPPE